ncbi:MAG: Ig-like domain-containing protein [Chitinispirillales bacterium]|jgi:hypothetical protein|nr:Ig-like domain-containing protein [Chitinispirillales bacterium]
MKNKQTVFMGIVLSFFTAALIMVGCSKDDGDKSASEVKIPDNITAVVPEGVGELSQGDDIQTVPIIGTKFEDIIDNGFVDLYMEALKGSAFIPTVRGGNTRAANDSKRTYIGYGDVYGGVRVVHEKGGDLEVDKYSYESIANEFFDYSNVDSLYLGGSVSYFNAETKNQNGGVNRIEQCDGTIRFNGKFKGEIVFDNVVCSRKIENGVSGKAVTTGKFQLKSGSATIDLPDSLIKEFCYSQSEKEEVLESTDTSETVITQPSFVAVSGIKCDILSSINVGGKISLLASVTPFDASNRKIVWSVTKASIDALGREVTFDTVGTATITATIANGKAKDQAYTQTWNVRVVGKDEFVAVDSIVLAIPQYLKPSAQITFDLYEAVIFPKNATKQTILWRATGASAITKDGVTTGFIFDSEGQATITATIAGGKSQNSSTTADGTVSNGDYVKTWTVIITKDVPVFVAVTDIILGGYDTGDISDTIIVDLGAKGNINEFEPTALPANATNKTIVWTASEGLTLTPNLDVSFDKLGTFTLTATIANGAGTNKAFTKTFMIKVVEEKPCEDCGNVDFVSVENIDGGFPSYVVVGAGIPLSNGFKVLPQNATNKTIEWNADGNMATINANGMMVFNNVGTVTITATIKRGVVVTEKDPDGTVTASIKDYVQRWEVVVGNESTGDFVAVNDIVFMMFSDSIIVDAGTKANINELAPEVFPSNATNKNIVWTAGQGLTMTSDLTVAFDKAGRYTITATIANGRAPGQAYTKIFTIIVSDEGEDKPCKDCDGFVAVTNIDGTFPTTVVVGAGIPLSNGFKVLPQNATNQKIEWSVVGEMATINTNGMMVFGNVGAVTVIAMIKDGYAPGQDYVLGWTVQVMPNANSQFVAVDSIVANSIPKIAAPGSLIPFNMNNIATVFPSNATNKNISWVFDGACTYNPFTQDLVFDKGEGLVTITASIVNGSELGGSYFMQTWGVSVQGAIAYTPVTEIHFMGTADKLFPLSYTLGETLVLSNLYPTVYPANATYKDILWSTADVTMTVSSNGDMSFTFDKPGKVFITATIENGLTEGQPFVRNYDIEVK